MDRNNQLGKFCSSKDIDKLISKLNAKNYNNYIWWIPFDKFKNIGYLTKGGFGEVYKAIWVNDEDQMEHKNKVVLKRIYNSSDKIIDILKEVKWKFITNVNLSLFLNEILCKFTWSQ